LRVITTSVLLALLLCCDALAATTAQRNPAPRRQPSPIAGEYRDVSEGGSLTFNIERNRRTRRYRLWVGSMGTSSMNYHEAHANDLRLDARTGVISFRYTVESEQCSFSGTVRNGRITGELVCTVNGQRETKRVVLQKFR
jgi:hypothetical protein